MKNEELDKLRNRLSIEAKNGIDFIISAAIIWAAIAFIWTLKADAYNKSILVFIAGGPMLPLALLLSKILKTKWKVADNPLQPLGLWLNFAQVLYFPFLIFILIKQPEYFVMTYAIITGAHFLPYSWFYNTKWYAVFAVIISFGGLILALSLCVENQHYIGVFTSISLFVLSILLRADYKKKGALLI